MMRKHPEAVRRLRVLAQAGVVEPLLRRARSQAARGVEVSEIGVTIITTGGQASILAEYTLRATEPGTSNTLLLDARWCPFPVVAVEGDALRPWVKGPGKPAVVALQLREGASWDHVRFQMQLDWPALASSGGRPAPVCCIVPESLPSVLSSLGREDGRRRAVLSVSPDRGGYEVCGVPWAPSGAQALGERYVQATIFPRNAFWAPDADSGVPLWLSQELRRGLGEGREGWARWLVQSIVRFLVERSGIDPGLGLVLVTRVEMTSLRMVPSGLCISFDHEAYGLRSPEDPSQDFLIAGAIGSAWWGCGVKVVGRHGRELAGGIAMAHALRWLEHVGENQQCQRACSLLAQQARSGRLRDLAMGVEGFARPRMTGSVALAVNRALAEYPEEAPHAVQELTRHNWCRTIDCRTAAATLSAGGIELPGLAG